MPDLPSQHPLQKLDRAPLSKRLAELSGRSVQAPANVAEATARLQVRQPETTQKGVIYAVIDVSGSMAGNPLDQARRGFVDFARDAINSRYEVGLIAFGDNAEEVSRSTKDLPTLTRAAQNLAIKGTTNMAAGIELATTRLDSVRHERVIFLVTDGAPKDHAATFKAAELAKRSGIDIMTLGTEGADHAFLKQIASREALAQRATVATLQIGMASSAKLLLGG